MKKVLLWFSLCIILQGCGTQPVYETIGNVWENPQVQALPASIEFALPDDAQMEVMESTDSCCSYQVGDWMLWTEIRDGGDVMETIRSLTGMQEPVSIRHTTGQYPCYETAWSVVEEEGEYVLRTAVIPQGQYHYCLSIKAPQEDARQVGEFFTSVVKSVYLNGTET